MPRRHARAGALPALLAASLLTGCGENHNNKAEVQALMDTSRAWSKAVARGNLNDIIGYWADDAVVMMPGEPVRRGKAQIRPYVESSLKTPGFSISWEPVEGVISKSGDVGYLIERERITFPDGHGGITQRMSRGVTVWRKQPDGSWKNVVDISQPTDEPGASH